MRVGLGLGCMGLWLGWWGSFKLGFAVMTTAG